MLDIKFIRENAAKVKEAAKNKNIDLDIDKLLKLDEEKRGFETKIDELRAKRNELARGGKPSPEAIEEGKKIKKEIAKLEEKFTSLEKEFFVLMAHVPNIPSEDTPIGPDEKANREVYRWGKIPQFKFTPKTHIELAKGLDIIDFERGVKVAGYRGYFLKNEVALLAMSLMQYAFNKIVKKGFGPMIPPTLVKEFALFGSGYFKGTEYNGGVDEIYQVATSDKEADGEISREKKFLIGTAEPSLLAYYAGEILKEEDLPIKICGLSPCYRSEIGSYGKDTKGLYRVHEFMKVEQIVISRANIEESNKLQKEMIDITKKIYEEMNIPYRVIQISTGDMGVGKYKMFDLEVWLPGQNRWGEVGSASNCLDWQARRLNIKYIDKQGNKKFAYLLNNTVLPTPRPLIAILENFQEKDGSIKIPKVLQKYCGFKKIKNLTRTGPRGK